MKKKEEEEEKEREEDMMMVVVEIAGANCNGSSSFFLPGLKEKEGELRERLRRLVSR